jgi:hypothetical protein
VRASCDSRLRSAWSWTTTAGSASPVHTRIAAYPNPACLTGRVQVLATPKQADVYVDGFFAGFVNDFDGTFNTFRPRRRSRHHVVGRLPDDHPALS